MTASVSGATELVGTSTESWEQAAQAVIESAASALRVARIVEQEILTEPGKPLTYRVKMELSFADERSNPDTSDDDQWSDVSLVDAALEA